jgi:large subunit ribosomal protein L25
MPEEIKVSLRSERGKHPIRRLRKSGQIPAVIYGHGQETVALSVGSEQMAAALRHGSRFVNLTGGVNESALVRELQWDTYGTEVLHVDFARVSLDERIAVNVGVDLKGTAEGTKEGGVVQQLIHEVEIECLPTAIPDKLHVNVNHLKLNDEVLASAIPLPEGAKLLSDPDAVVVHCILPTVAPEEGEAVAGEGAEPELIGRKPAEEEAAEE